MLGSSGNIGGSLSHEFHFLANVGEDKLKICSNCNLAINTELYDEQCCKNCDNSSIESKQGIEVMYLQAL